MRFIAQEVSVRTLISLMSQYMPCYKSDRYPELCRRISEEEYAQAKQAMLEYDISHGWIQESGGLAHFAGTKIKPR